MSKSPPLHTHYVKQLAKKNRDYISVVGFPKLAFAAGLAVFGKGKKISDSLLHL